MKTKKLTKEAEESLRKSAKHDLSHKTTYSDLATAYLASKTEGFGDYDQGLIEQGVYLPAIEKSSPIIADLMIQSRKDGQRYSGQIDEASIIESAYKHLLDRISALKTDDIADYLGSDKKGEEFKKIKGQYIRDLDQDIQKKLTQMYTSYMTQSKLAMAMLAKTKEFGKHGLETILKAEVPTQEAQ